jgi:hypothetical protein
MAGWKPSHLPDMAPEMRAWRMAVKVVVRIFFQMWNFLRLSTKTGMRYPYE